MNSLQHEKNLKKQKVILLRAEKMARPLGYSQLLIDTYLHFSRLLNQVKDYEGAATYQKKYIGLKDSLFNEELVKNIAKVQTNYEERKTLQRLLQMKSLSNNHVI